MMKVVKVKLYHDGIASDNLRTIDTIAKMASLTFLCFFLIMLVTANVNTATPTRAPRLNKPTRIPPVNPGNLQWIPNTHAAKKFKNVEANKTPESTTAGTKSASATKPAAAKRTLEYVEADRVPVAKRQSMFAAPPMNRGYAVPAPKLGKYGMGYYVRWNVKAMWNSLNPQFPTVIITNKTSFKP